MAQQAVFNVFRETHFFESLEPLAEHPWASNFSGPSHGFSANHATAWPVYPTTLVSPAIFDENDAERSLQLMAVDPNTRQLASMTRDSDFVDKLKDVHYELLRVAPFFGIRSGQSVFRNGDEYYFSSDNALVPDDICHALESKPLDQVAFRAPYPGELPRANFRVSTKYKRLPNWR